jgi:hypothetical protein
MSRKLIVLLIFGFKVKIIEILAQFASATCYFSQLGLISSSELCYRKTVYVLPVVIRLICMHMENKKYLGLYTSYFKLHVLVNKLGDHPG